MITFIIPVLLRGLFIIDDKGILRQITLNDLPVGRSVEETLRLVQAFQYTDKHGEGIFLSETLFFYLKISYMCMTFGHFLPLITLSSASPTKTLLPIKLPSILIGDPLSFIRVACMR